MNGMVQSLALNIVAGLLVAGIVWLLGQRATQHQPTVPTGALASSVPRLGWRRLSLACLSFALVALAVDVFQPPPPMEPVIPIGYRPTSPEYLLYRAERVRHQARQDAENQLRQAQSEANRILEHGMERHKALLAQGQTNAAQAALRLAERSASLTLDTSRENARQHTRSADSTAQELEKRATASMGSLGEVLGVTIAALSRASGTIVRTFLLALLLASLASRWFGYTQTALPLKPLAIVASGAGLVAVAGFGIAAELLVPPAMSAIMYAGSVAGLSTTATLRLALSALRGQFALALGLCGAAIAATIGGWYIGEGIDAATHYLAQTRDWNVPMTYGAFVPAALFAFEFARAAVGITLVQQFALRSAALRTPSIAI